MQTTTQPTHPPPLAIALSGCGVLSPGRPVFFFFAVFRFPVLSCSRLWCCPLCGLCAAVL